MKTITRKPLVAGNWKMNGTLAQISEFNAAFDASIAPNVEKVLCVPAVFLSLVDNEYLKVGAQDVSPLDNGAHTGDISSSMLREIGCQYVIVGHSERRDDHSESSSLVAEKAKKVIAEGLTPIVCVGEPLEVREGNTVNAFISEQLDAVSALLSLEELKQCVVAYEPIWAIGTGKTASPQQAQEVHKFIRAYFANIDKELAVSLQILYGGSVKADNADTLFAQEDVDGGLIGGASLKTEDFISICQAAN